MKSHRNGVKCTRGKRARLLSKTPAALRWPRLPKPLLPGHTKVCPAPATASGIRRAQHRLRAPSKAAEVSLQGA